MRIGIDYTAAAWQHAGIGRYARELIHTAIRLDATFEYRLFYAAGGIDAHSPYLAELRRLCAQHPNVRAVPIPLSPRRLTQLWQRLRFPLPVEVFTGPLDLLHSPDFVLPPTRARSIVTVHDLSFYVYPQFAAQGMVRYLTDAVPRSVRRADAILADSEATRRDLERYLGIEPQRVEVLYPGVTSAFRPLPPEACAPVRHKLNLPDSYLVFVSTLSPRKNVVRLVEAFHTLTAGGRYPELHLLLVGQRGWLYEEIFATIERLNLSQQVHALDFVDDNDLPAVYNLSQASVYPSLYEGFGLPPLEALACGTPLVTSNNSSLPEVAGDAAVLVNAESVTAIADGIAQVLDDAVLRDRLRAAGPVRAQRFTWEQAAHQLLARYRAHYGSEP